MQEILFQYVDSLGWVLYLLIFLGMLMEGEVVLFSSMFLVKEEKLALLWVFMAIISGVVLGDSLWYFFGSQIKRFKKISLFIRKIAKKVDHLIVNKTGYTIVFIRFVYGIYHPTLLRVHDNGVSYKKFLKFSVLGSLLWVSVIGCLAYFFIGSSYLVAEYVKYSEIALLVGLLVFLVFGRFISRYFGKRVVG